MAKPVKLSEMAEMLNTSPKTFRKQVLETGIPHLRVGKRGMRFDPNEVRAYITVISQEPKSNVVALPVSLKKRKSVITSTKFANA